MQLHKYKHIITDRQVDCYIPHLSTEQLAILYIGRLGTRYLLGKAGYYILAI